MRSIWLCTIGTDTSLCESVMLHMSDTSVCEGSGDALCQTLRYAKFLTFTTSTVMLDISFWEDYGTRFQLCIWLLTSGTLMLHMSKTFHSSGVVKLNVRYFAMRSICLASGGAVKPYVRYFAMRSIWPVSGGFVKLYVRYFAMRSIWLVSSGCEVSDLLAVDAKHLTQ